MLYGIGDYIAQKATGTQNSVNDKVSNAQILLWDAPAGNRGSCIFQPTSSRFGNVEYNYHDLGGS